MDGTNGLRSARWFGGADLAGFIHRASLHAEGISRSALSGRPVVGICNSWSELVNCNLHFRSLAEAVKRGVLLAGGLPLEFPTIGLGENLMKPTAMLYRNLMSMDVEESIRAYPLDAVVLLGGCDKTVPAQLMGAASADVPAIMVAGGPSEPAWFRGRQLGAGTDLWHYADELRAGRMSAEEFAELEAAATPTFGTCNEMGTASTMAALVEALGMSLPGTATIPAVSASRARAAEATGRRAVELAVEGLTPRQILTAEAFDNAITLLAAVGGGTNAVVHLLALAGRVGVPLTLDRFGEVASQTPLLVNVRPSGEHLDRAAAPRGRCPRGVEGARAAPPRRGADRDRQAARGRVRHRRGARPRRRRDARRAARAPGAISVVRGSLAPSGALVKRSAASPHLLRHRGPALVFEDVYDVAARIDDPALDVAPETVLVLRNSGPKGGPGMPEWGQIPIPSKLLAAGVTDMVRVSDARMSGTAFGTVVLHVAPESAAGGPLRALRDGDTVELDVDAGRIDVDVPGDEIAARLERLGPAEVRYRRGYGAMYLDHVLQADEGCDFDFLRARPDDPEETEPYGLLSGWVGGW